MFIRQTGPTIVTCETTNKLMPDYQKNATYLCLITVYQKTVLVFMLDIIHEITVQVRYLTVLENAHI